MSQTTSKPIEIAIANHILTTKTSASCLGVKWRSDLSAHGSVNTNISKARKAFFGLGSTGVYHGKLNPLSSSSILSLLFCQYSFMDVKLGCLMPPASSVRLGVASLNSLNTTQVMQFELL